MCFSPWKFRNDGGVLLYCITLLQALSHGRESLEKAIKIILVCIDTDCFTCTLIILSYKYISKDHIYLFKMKMKEKEKSAGEICVRERICYQ